MDTHTETLDAEPATADVQFTQEFVDDLVDKIMKFMEVLVGYPLRPYQQPFARRIIESLLINDGETMTGLWARQSGKSETVANTVATLMILLPVLAKIYPQSLGRFSRGLWVGLFAPVEGQVENLFGRVVERLTSERATEILMDPGINDRAGKPSGAVKTMKMRNGSFVSMMTANPRAKIESRSFSLIIIDEAQDCDDYVVSKSIMPMKSNFNGSVVKIGTPTTHKGQFYRDIMHNKSRQTERNSRRMHFEAHWKTVAKYHPDYGNSVKGDMLRMGEDSDAFQMSYCLRWLLERGMFTTEARFVSLGDQTMQELVKAWYQTPVVVGIDPARKMDKTVVTVVFVDWERPDEFGYYNHRVLNWLELDGDWPDQLHLIQDFLEPYNIIAVGVDASGLGDVVAQMLAPLLRHKNCEILPVSSNTPDQSARWKHLMMLMERGRVTWPAGSKVRRLKLWQRFEVQMLQAEKHFQNAHILIKAPEEADAHDDFVDSLAIACSMTKDLTMPTIEVANNMFYSRSRY